VPGAEYERDPNLIEMQARLIASAPALLKLARDLHNHVRTATEVEDDLVVLARRADQIRKLVDGDEAAPAPKVQAI